MKNTDQIDTLKLFGGAQLRAEMHACRALDAWIEAFLTLQGAARREASMEIRKIACAFPRLADRIPDAVWKAVYRVRAAGTVSP